MNDEREDRGHGEQDDDGTARRLDHGLRELLGNEAPPDVTNAVLARAAADDAGDADGTLGRAAPGAAWRRSRWIAAAALCVLGTSIVVAVASLQRRADRDAAAGAVPGPMAEPQDPAADQVREVASAAEIATLPIERKAVQLRNQDDAAVAAVVARCPSLELLQIWASTASARADDGETVSITDAAFASIAKLSRLRRLELHGTVSVTGSGLRELEHLPLLDTLVLRCFDVDDEHLEVLPRLPSLRSLDLAYDQSLGAAGLAAIGQCPGLRRLCLFATPGRPAVAFAPLARLRELEELDLGGINVVTRGVRDMATRERFARELRGRGATWPELGTGPEPVPDGGVTAAALQDWPRLTKLSLREASGIDGDGAVQLQQRYRRLRELDLRGCRNVDDRAVVHLAALPSLRVLRLGGCGVSEISLPVLVAATQLRVVDFGTATGAANAPWLTLEHVERLLESGKRVDWLPPPSLRAAFAELLAHHDARLRARFEQVRSLDELEALPDDVTRIECRGLGDRAAQRIARRPRVEALEWIGDAPDDRLTGGGFAALCRLPVLRSLELMDLPHLTAADLVQLGGLRRLRELRCIGVAVDDGTLAALRAASPSTQGDAAMLRELALVGVRSFGEPGMAAIGRCHGLLKLDLAKCTQLDADALAHVGSLRALEELDLSGNPGLRDRTVMALQHCVALRRLNLADGMFTSQGLQALAGMRQLAELDLSGNGEIVSSALLHVPADVQVLALDRCGGLDASAATLLRDRFPRLRELRLGQNGWVTDDVLRALVTAPSLQQLDLMRCGKLTNASFETIRAARNLRLVRCLGTACVTKAQQAALRTERPELRIELFEW